MAKNPRLYREHPYTCMDEALRRLKCYVVKDEQARNEFLEVVDPLVCHLIHVTMRRCQAILQSADLEDLREYVRAYLIEKWFPRLKNLGSPASAVAYLEKTVDGLVLNFLNEEVRVRMPTCDPSDKRYEPEARWVPLADFDMDRRVLKRWVKRETQRYLRFRRRASEVRDVVERMVRLQMWKRYQSDGQLTGSRAGDPAHRVARAVSVRGAGVGAHAP